MQATSMTKEHLKIFIPSKITPKMHFLKLSFLHSFLILPTEMQKEMNPEDVKQLTTIYECIKL